MTQRKSFVGNLQIAWDSTSLGILMECPRKYYLSMVEGWAPRETSVHLTFGIHYHKALETYDHAKSSGASHEEAQIAATRYCLSIDFPSDDSNKNKSTLLRSVVWYLEQFADDSLKTVQLRTGKPAVELSSQFEIMDAAGHPISYCGHIDRLVMFENKYYILDRKTTKYMLDGNYFFKFRPNHQITGYVVLASITYNEPIAGAIIDGAQILVGATRFARNISTRSEFEREEWLQLTTHYIQQAIGYATNEWWPMNPKSCDNYGGCPFRAICARPTQKTREALIELDFKKNFWDPLETRGDI